ncbi:DEAD/DEAH box helicase family protein [uncultured Prevotella sp.]|uniref:DEAD/DEAH box helicase family protein n=1 Tax=uncultured Prevotella sp. TaxID=159272 RepID=UPI00266F108F|nr:DEAD/DEAH box helicase family protein [uncultured Prevotella sp.]
MLYEVDWAEDGTYRPGEYNSPEKFFNDGLENSNEFDLQLGYFSSATISVLADGFATFISKGGKMRLVINHIVSTEDKDAISKGLKGGFINCFDLTDFDQLRKTFDEYTQQFFECLAFLIYHKRIDIRIIKPRNKKGISHTKSGQFRDGDSTTSFTGSANFTISGLFNNLEEIKIDRSDSLDAMTRKRIESQSEEFNSIMRGTKRNIEYLSPENLISAIKTNYGDKDIEELLDVEAKLRKIKHDKKVQELKQQESVVSEPIEEILPCFPFPSGPRDYQQLAFDNWKNNGQKGLFAMATGTGKTITSLNCLLEIYKRKGYYKAIILVPTITLVNQWEQECRKFRFSNIIKVYSKNLVWRDEVERVHFNEKYKSDKDPEVSYIIISTYASYSREKVFNVLNGFDKRRVLVIADECHNMGSGSLVKRLKEIPYLRRIGLSATPERQFDENGNNKLRKFFGSEEHYTYEYSMKEAIDKGVLCRYMYYPHIVKLTSDEMDAYLELSEKISRYFNYNTCSFDEQDEMLKRLLLARKRIIHKAVNKLAMFKEIIQKRFEEKGNLKYSLIYVPEGNRPDYIGSADDFDHTEEIADDNDAEHLINQYTLAVTEIDRSVTVRKFVSGQQDREEILSDFAAGKLHVLTSMKCLDEGVDVPRSELAIFCSSTGNPRQFIQRRGRVLRTHKDKKMAELHDLVVVPEVSPNSNSYRMEQSLLRGELARVNNFALLSENPSYSEMELRGVLDHYGLNLYNNDHIQ